MARPDPLDEARNALYYFDQLFHDVAGGVLREWHQTLGAAGVDVDPLATPLTFGTWIGGDRDGNPNVTPAVTLQVIRLQRERTLSTTPSIWWTASVASSRCPAGCARRPRN